MKKITLFTIVMLAAASLTSQAQRLKYTIVDDDTTLVYKKRHMEQTYKGTEAKKIWTRESRGDRWGWMDGNYMGISFMYNGLIDNLHTLQLTGEASDLNLMTKSIGMDINLMDAVIYSYRSFGVVMGLGIESNNYRFANNVSITKDGQGNTMIDNSFTERGIHLSKSKLTTTYLNIPLLLQFKFPRSSGSFGSGYVSAGVIAGIRLQSYTKTISAELGKQKVFNDFNLRNFHFGFMASVGYAGFNVTAKYYPHSIFRAGQIPYAEQVSIGIGYSF